MVAFCSIAEKGKGAPAIFGILSKLSCSVVIYERSRFSSLKLMIYVEKKILNTIKKIKAKLRFLFFTKVIHLLNFLCFISLLKKYNIIPIGMTPGKR